MAVRQPDNPPKGAVRGDWFRDQSGQIWVFQDYGGWATTRREGIGKDLTSVYEEQLNGGDNNTSIENTTSFNGDYLKRYKFFGNKVCNVLGLPENYWIYSPTS